MAFFLLSSTHQGWDPEPPQAAVLLPVTKTSNMFDLIN